MTEATNSENLGYYKIKFCLIPEQILAFSSNHDMVREVKNLPPYLKQIACSCFTILIFFIWVVRYIVLVNSKRFHQKLYLTDNIADITCHFLQINQEF